jgi:ribosomal protein S27E
MTSKKCLICGKEFTPKNWCQNYCSPECYKENSRRQSAKRVFRKVKCERCGRELTTTSKAEKVLCRDCARAKKGKPASRRVKSYAEIRARNLANPLKSEYRGQRCGGCLTPPKTLMLTPKGEN